MKNEKGFSLVELLIVVAIIAIIAAIAVPSLLTARQAANEASAIQGLRTIGSAEIAFAATQNQQFTTLDTLVTGLFLDARFSGGGYINGYTYVSGGVDQTTADGATPTSFGFVANANTGMGRYQYQIAPDQVVRFGTPAPSFAATGDPIGKST